MNAIKEKNWFLNHPFFTWFIFMFAVGILIITSILMEESKIDSMELNEKEQYLLEKQTKKLIANLKSTLSFDGVANDDNMAVLSINYTNTLEEHRSCTDNKALMSIVEIDITDKTTGAIDKFVGDDFTWGLDASRTTFKKLYTDVYSEDYRKNIGYTLLTFKKTPEPTIDKYGNDVIYNPINLGIIALCSSTETRINWGNMGDARLKELVAVDWIGSKGTGLADRLRKKSQDIEKLQTDLNMLTYMSSLPFD